MPWTPEIGDQIFTVIAKIDGVYTEAGWFYATCSQCSKMLEVCNGSFWCNICNGSSRYPMIRYDGTTFETSVVSYRWSGANFKNFVPIVPGLGYICVCRMIVAILSSPCTINKWNI